MKYKTIILFFVFLMLLMSLSSAFSNITNNNNAGYDGSCNQLNYGQGMAIEMNQNRTLHNVTVTNFTDASTVSIVHHSNNSFIAEANIVNHVANFPQGIFLGKNEKYEIYTYNGGANYDSCQVAYTYTVNSTQLNWYLGSNDNGTADSFTKAFNIVSITSTGLQLDLNYTIGAPEGYSGELTNMTLNISFDELTMADLDATLIYDSTVYNPTKTNNTNHFFFDVEVNTAVVDVNTNISFIWRVNVTHPDTTITQTDIIGNHSVLTWSLDNCSNYNTSAINISFYDMQNNLVAVDIDTTVYYGISQSDLNKNYSDSFISLNNYSYCIFPENANFTSNIRIQYTNGSLTYNTILQDIVLNNIGMIQNLYFDSLATTQVLFTLVDQNNDALAGYYIHIMKYDLGNNTYRTTEILETDDEGQTIGNIELIDGLYRVLVYDPNNALVYSNPSSSGSGIRILTNTRTFQIDLLGSDWFDDSVDVVGTSHSLIFNNVTKTFTFSWSNPAGTSLTGCIKVIKRNLTAEKTIGANCATTSSGSVSQNIGVSEQEVNTKYIATGYFNSEPNVVETMVIGLVEALKLHQLDKTGDTVLLSGVVVLGFTLLGIPLPVVSLSLMVLGFIGLYMLGLFKASLAFIVGLVIVVLIQMYKIGK